MNELTGSTGWEDLVEFYDQAAGDRQNEIAHYTRLLQPGESLVDLGCGTGTITAALAKSLRENSPDGIPRIVGVEGAERILDTARRRHGALAEWVLGDLQSPSVESPFDLAISTYNTLQCVNLNGFQAAVRSARALLRKGGRFAFDIYQPNPEFLKTPRIDRVARLLPRPGGGRYELREDCIYDEAISLLHFNWRVIDPAEPMNVIAEIKVQMWQHFHDDVLDALKSAAFAVTEKYGDLDRKPFDSTSLKQVIVCEAI